MSQVLALFYINWITWKKKCSWRWWEWGELHKKAPRRVWAYVLY